MSTPTPPAAALSPRDDGWTPDSRPGATAPDLDPLALRTLPRDVRDISATAATERTSPSWANEMLANIADVDLSAACLLWRNLSNIPRLRDTSLWDQVAWDISCGGYLVATNFTPGRTQLTPTSGGYELTATSLMTTGVGYARALLVEATVIGTGEAKVVLVDRSAITAVRRPELAGLQAADNALIDLACAISPQQLLAGDADSIIELPYALGLTMAAVTLGGCRQLLAMSRALDLSEDQCRARGRHVSAVMALEALVAAAPAHGPRAGRHSRAAKVFASQVSSDLVAWTRETLGAAGYSATHPLHRLAGDLIGLAYQAPADHGASLSLGRAIAG